MKGFRVRGSFSFPKLALAQGHYGFTARLAFSPDGTRLASNDWDGTVTIWDATPLP